MIHSEKLNYTEPYNLLSREVLKRWLNHCVTLYCKFYKALSNHTLILKLPSVSELTGVTNKLLPAMFKNCSDQLPSKAGTCLCMKISQWLLWTEIFQNQKSVFFFYLWVEEATFISSYWNDVCSSRDLHTGIFSFINLL